ncbi:MAG TPA: serine/threonine-protein kinase, partial [Polyangia bacterium]|nr:serine/threonine-protein kinase [Polyangia bacterium]
MPTSAAQSVPHSPFERSWRGAIFRFPWHDSRKDISPGEQLSLEPFREHAPAPAQIGSFEPDAVLDGTYEIVRRLAQGGMGSVYVARHLRLGGELVVKTLGADYASTAEGSARFHREAEILARLRHPNVVRVVDFNVSQTGVPYLAMELLDGPDLRTALGRGRIFSPAETMTIVRQVASALSAAHACDIIHRDLKPENVVLCRAAGQMPIVKVIDFGISLWGAKDHAKIEDVVFGTPEFMAPE